MKKIYLVGHVSIRDAVIDRLRNLGVIQIDPFCENELSQLSQKTEANIPNSHNIEDILIKLEYLCSFFVYYHEKPSFFESILSPKLGITDKKLADLTKKTNVSDIYNEVFEIESEIKRLQSENSKLTALVSELVPWSKLKIAIDELSATSRSKVVIGTVKKKKFLKFKSKIDDVTNELQLILVNEGKDYSNFILIYLKEHSDDISTILKDEEVRLHKFEKLIGSASEIIKDSEQTIIDNEKKLIQLNIAAKKITKENRNDILILLDYYSEQLAKNETLTNFVHTEQSFSIQGWIRTKDSKSIIDKLNKEFDELLIKIRDPLPDETPPVELDNKKVFNPFEFVTTLYSNPSYKEIDPTPLLAPFFVIFFAFCLTDAGYGLTLALVSIIALRLFRNSVGAKKLFKILLVCGLMTGFLGALTGGWFGIESTALFEPLRKIIIIDPLKEPLKLLDIAFLLGVIQIFFGLFIKMYTNLREKEFLAAIFDQFAWILFLSFLAPLGYQIILGGNVSVEFTAIAKTGSLVMLGIIILTNGRSQKNILLKPLMGIVKLYDVVGYFGDVLSYARLLALGLATSAIALTVNSVAKMVLDLPYYTGYIAAVLVIICGHIFNLVISSLGAFVHSMRLQYLEFFSKFFTGGGKSFSPFKEDRKYSTIINDKSHKGGK